MKNALVLGGTGFVGRQVCEALHRDVWCITVPTRRARHAQAVQHLPRLTVLEANVHDAGALNALMAGEQSAVSLGLDPRRVRLLVFVVASLLTGVLVSLSGAIGFVGLMLPHVARFLVGAEHRRVLPVAALLGALFLVWVDVAARTWLAPP